MSFREIPAIDDTGIDGSKSYNFGGDYGKGYAFAVTNVPEFTGVNLGPQATGPAQYLADDVNAMPVALVSSVNPVTVQGVSLTPAVTATQVLQPAQAAAQPQGGIPLLWIGAGLLALFLLSK